MRPLGHFASYGGRSTGKPTVKDFVRRADKVAQVAQLDYNSPAQPAQSARLDRDYGVYESLVHSEVGAVPSEQSRISLNLDFKNMGKRLQCRREVCYVTVAGSSS